MEHIESIACIQALSNRSKPLIQNPHHMPRPKTQSELLNLSQENFDKLLNFIDNLTPEKREGQFPKGNLNRNVKDVLMHLHHWHLLLHEWYTVGMSGTKPEMPAPGYTWKNYSGLNIEINKKYKNISLEEANKLLKKSHQNVMQLINAHSNEELFTKKKYKWTGSTSLGAYLVSSTSSHYDWAIKLTKKCTR